MLIFYDEASGSRLDHGASWSVKVSYGLLWGFMVSYGVLWSARLQSSVFPLCLKPC